MPTLQDVAKRAGVSTATVSKVLSNTPYFTDQTRDRVMEAVQELGYRPNLAARALASGKTHIIAVVFPYVYDAIFKDPLVMQILEGIESVCNQHHYNILLSTPRLTPDTYDERYLQLVQSGYIEGLIAIDNVNIASAAAPAIEMEIPSVGIGYHPAHCTVRSDDFAGGQLLMHHVLETGHRNIGIITTPHDTNFAISQRFEGLRQAAEQHQIDFDGLPVAVGNFSTQSGAQAVEQLLTDYPDLTVIISLNDRMAIGAMQQLQRQGKRVPQEISVVGYDNIATSSVLSPALTTIDQQASELGRRAAETLFAVFNDEAPSNVVLTPKLVIRESTAAQR